MTQHKMVALQSVSPEMWGDHDGSSQILREIVADGLQRIAAEQGGTLLVDTVSLSDSNRRWVYPVDEDGNQDGVPYEVVDTRWTAMVEGPDGWTPNGSGL